ncbi:MAG: metallophosphoesterase [Alphaproteobacteria bacterium]|nr:metallophosphoesterase [Alphaproteobacteria bacterium]
MFRVLILGMAIICAALSAAAHAPGPARKLTPPWQDASPWPDRIVVTFAGDPARTLALNWRTDDTVDAAVAEIVKATPDARFDLDARRVNARSERLELASVKDIEGIFDIGQNAGLPPVRFHSVLFDGLEPDTVYAYRVGATNGEWSEWFQVRTAPISGPVTFLYLGDAQNGILSHWSRTVRAAYAMAPDANFIIHAGDLVDEASRDFEWAQWFKAVGFIHGMVPAIPVAGNHEYMNVSRDPTKQRRLLSILWRPQFNLPVEASLPDTLRETVYKVAYSEDLDVFVLDTQNGELAAQAAWLDRALAESKARWRVVTFHHPIFSSGKGRDSPERRAALLPILKKYDVDLVLQGHDHTYARGDLAAQAPAQSPERRASRVGDAIGPVFVNSVSGPKQYEWSPGGWERYAGDGVQLRRAAENTQFFQVIRILGGMLLYEAWTADGALYDSFGLVKDETGQRRSAPGATVTMPERRFKDTMPYRSPSGSD